MKVGFLYKHLHGFIYMYTHTHNVILLAMAPYMSSSDEDSDEGNEITSPEVKALLSAASKVSTTTLAVFHLTNITSCSISPIEATSHFTSKKHSKGRPTE